MSFPSQGCTLFTHEFFFSRLLFISSLPLGPRRLFKLCGFFRVSGITLFYCFFNDQLPKAPLRQDAKDAFSTPHRRNHPLLSPSQFPLLHPVLFSFTILVEFEHVPPRLFFSLAEGSPPVPSDTSTPACRHFIPMMPQVNDEHGQLSTPPKREVYFPLFPPPPHVSGGPFCFLLRAKLLVAFFPVHPFRPRIFCSNVHIEPRKDTPPSATSPTISVTRPCFFPSVLPPFSHIMIFLPSP